MPPPAEGFTARLVLGPALRTQPDRRLVALVREGYELAFEEIVRRYGKALARYAAAIVGSRGEDVTQDAFSKALLALRRDGAEIELRPWLFRIVRNTALNDLRDSPPTPELLAEAIAGGRNPAEEFERREELTDLIRRLQSLPEPQRAAIVMRELEGLGHEEIATALGLSGGGARQAIYRARRALRDGAGMLLPLPLLKTLLAWASSAPVDAAAGAAGLGGAAGAGVALKAATATVLVAGALGAGVAIDHNRHSGPPQAAKTRVVADDPEVTAQTGAGTTAAAETGDQAERHGHHGGEHGSNGGHGSDDGGPRGEPHRGGGNISGSGGDDQGGEDRGGERLAVSGDDHGGNRGPSGQDDSGARSGRGPSGSSGDGGGSGGSSGPGSGDGGGSISSGEGSGSDGGGSGSNSGPGSGGDGSAGEEIPLDGSGSGDSGDSHGGDGFSLQTEPQTQEEP